MNCGKIPFGSITSTLFVASGTALFFGGGYVGLKASEDFLKENKQENVESNISRVEDIKNYFLYACCALSLLMLLYCIVLLIMGFLSSSKDDVWGGGSFMSHTTTGRAINLVLIVVTFVMIIMWTGFLCFSVAPVTTLFFLYRTTGNVNKISSNSSLDLRHYLVVPFSYENNRSLIQNSQFEEAHEDIKNDLFPFFLICWGGALICLWGLAGYLTSLATTWGKGVESKKTENYLHRRNMEQRELDICASGQGGENFHM